LICLLTALAGFYICETPPADLDVAIVVISQAMKSAPLENLGMFFAEIGLEASPDEVHLWAEQDFYDMVMDFAPEAPDSGAPDSLLPLVESLPLELLENSED